MIGDARQHIGYLTVLFVFLATFHVGRAWAAPIFVDNGDGTVSDNATSLVWQQSDAQNSSGRTWQGCIDYCNGLILGGRSDWRLPTYDELKSIAFSYDNNPKIDTRFFPDCLSEGYWSSSDHAYSNYPYDPEKGWGIGFYYGGYFYGPKSEPLYVRCVRNQGDTAPVSFSPATLDFGAPAPGESVEKTVTITNNTGSQMFRDMQLTFNGPADYSRFEVLSPDFTTQAYRYLNPGSSVDVTIRYTSTRRGLVREQANFDYMYGTQEGGTGLLDVQAGTREETTETFGTKKRQQTSDDPVALATGELLHGPERIIDLGGPLPLVVERRHAGRLARENLSDDPDLFIGHNWLHNYRIKIEKAETASVDIAFLWGERLRFVKQDDQWTLATPNAVPFQLRQDAGGRFNLMDPGDERVYGFLADGRLKRIRDRNANQILITYVDELQGGEIRSISTITDGLGRSLTGVLRIDANRQESIYRTDGYLTSAKDMLGNTTQYQYTAEITDGGFQLAAVKRPLGNTPWTNAYDAQGRVVRQTDAYGNIWSFAYDTPEAGVTRITDPEGRESFSRHDSRAIWTGVSDAAGKSYALTADDAGRTAELTDRLGDKTAMTYHTPSGRLASMTNTKGQTTAWTYAPQEQSFTNPDNDETFAFTFHHLTRIDYPDGAFETFTYDAKGNRLTRTDRAGKIWTYTYNDQGQVLTATNPAGGVTTYAYNADATLAGSTDSDTGTTTYGYDTYKRLNLVTHPDETTVKMVYDKEDRLISLTDELNRITTFTWDANGNLLKITGPDNQEILYEYDLMDRLVQTTDRLGKISTHSYDALNRLAGMADATGVKVAYQYDPRGWLHRVIRAGKSWTTTYDGEGVPVSRTTPLERTAFEATDKLGFLATVADPLNRTTTFGRDAMNRIISVKDPGDRTTSYTYNTLGLMSGATLPDGKKVSYAYDDMGNLNQIDDLNGMSWKLAYTKMGRLEKLTDPLNRETRFGYDARGRLNATTYPGVGDRNLALTYDAAGNATRRLYTGGPDLQFAYDSRNRLLTANDIVLTRDAEGRITATSDGDTAFGATYDDAGRLKTAAYNNGAFAVTYTYDVGENGTGLLTGVSDSLTGTQVSFSYDDDRRLKTIGLPNGKTITQTWDAADRLTRIQSGGHVDLALTYDAGGRIASADLTAPLTPDTTIQTSSTALTCDAASQINAAGYGYDVRGRMTAAPGQTYTWDGASRLTNIGDVSLAYNGLDSLRTRTGGGATTHYSYNNAIGLSPIVAEKNGTTGQFHRYYVWTPGGRLLYLIDAADGNKVYFYHFDQIGSTLALTDADGAVTDAWAYDPYGRILNRTGTNPQPFTYAGAWGVRQEGAGGTLYQMRARYYDAVIGRFLTPEPIWPQLPDPKSLNPYQYAGADPILFADPTGLDLSNMSHEQRIQYLRSEMERIQQGKPTHFQEQRQAEIEAANQRIEKLFAWKRAEEEATAKAIAAREAELKKQADKLRALREAPPLPRPQEKLDDFEVMKQRAAAEVPLAQKAALGMWHMVLEMMNRRDREREELLGKRETINKIERMRLQKSIDKWDEAIAGMMGLIREELDGLRLR